MISTTQAWALFMVFAPLVGLCLAAWIDIKIIQPWRARRHDRH